METLGIGELKSYEEYLGLLAMVGRNKKASFDKIKQKVWKRLQDWEGKLLSQAGREVLIKSVIQAIPIYSMSCYKLPISLCHEIESLVRKFWWGQRGERRKVHWVKWEDMCRHKNHGGLGFKDLSMFNDAMLAKLAWRLLNDDKSLFFRVFKARFFPRSSFLEAKESSSASYAWASILKGREVIMKGGLWRVGDGKQIKIWGDQWLQSRNRTTISIPVIFGQDNSNVEVLINPRARCWRELTRFLHEQANPSQTEVADESFWKAVWKMNVPNKIKNFVWRVSRESLPVRANLFKRKIINDQLCEACKSETEDCSHALFLCSDLQVLWNHDQEWQWLESMKGSPARDIFKQALAEDKNAEVLSYMSWFVWNRRNKKRLNEDTHPLSHISALSKERLTEFQQLQTRPSPTQQRQHVRWKPPEPNVYKINYDGAAFFGEQNLSGIGVVVRDHHGAVMASLAQQVPLPMTIAQVESMAARRAVLFAQELGFYRVVIEGDSEIICKELNDPGPSLALHGNILQDIKSLVPLFEKLEFTHMRRQGNNVAHALARWALKSPSLTVWMENVPPDILPIVQADLAFYD